jgi:predicted RND superfamily exporter protein
VTDRLLDLFASLVVRFRVAVLALMAIVVAGALGVIAERRFEADFSPQALFTTFEDQQAVDAQFVELFGKTENIALFLIQAESVVSTEALAYIHTLSLAVQNAEIADRVESLTLSSLPRSGEPGELRVDPPIRGDSVEAEEREELLRGLERSGLLEGTLVSESRQTAVVAAFLGPERTEIEVVQPVVARLQQLIVENPPPTGVRVALAGIPYIRVHVVEKMLGDQIRLLPLAILISTMLLLLTFRWIPGVIGANTGVGLAIVLMLGGMSFFGEPFNIINQMLPILLIIIGMNDAIHLVARYAEELQHTGDRLEAARRTIKSMTVACFLTSFTTAIGFGTLIVSRTEILRRFGVTAAIAVMIAYVVMILVIPAALSFIKMPKKSVVATHEGKLDIWIDRWVGLSMKAPKVTLGIGAALIAFFFWGTTRVHVDTMLLETFPEHTEIHQQIKLLERELDGVLPFEILLRSETAGRFDDPELLNALDAFMVELRQQPAVLSATTYSDVLHEVWVAWSDDPARRDRPFASIAQVAQLASLLEDAESDPTTEYVTRDRTALRINVQVGDVGSRAAMVLSEEASGRLAAVLSPYPDVRFDLTGDAFSGSRGLESLISDMTSNLLLAMVIIFGVMTLLFRSLRMGLLSIPPNLIPLLGTAAWMGFRGIYLNTTTVIVFSIAIGLAVDDTIHMLSRFREELPRARNVEDAVHRAARGSGRAVLMTSLMLLGGLGTMAFSSFVPIRLFAELMASTIFFAVIGDLTLIPPLLKQFWPEKAPADLDTTPR